MIEKPYRAIWRRIEKKYGDDAFGDDLWKRFRGRLARKHPNILIFGFTSHGIACGPVSNTIYVAIDFAHRCDDGEDENGDAG